MPYHLATPPEGPRNAEARGCRGGRAASNRAGRLGCGEERRELDAPRAEAQPRRLLGSLDGGKELRLRGVQEAREQARGRHELALHGAEQRPVARREAQRRGVERLTARVGEAELARRGVEVAHEEGRLLDLDLAAEAAELHDEALLLGQV